MGLTPIMEHNKEVGKIVSNASYRQASTPAWTLRLLKWERLEKLAI
jgi:hypothetical protein